MVTLSELINNPFSEWLRQNGLYVAISVAGVLLIIILIILLLSKKKGH